MARPPPPESPEPSDRPDTVVSAAAECRHRRAPGPAAPAAASATLSWTAAPRRLAPSAAGKAASRLARAASAAPLCSHLIRAYQSGKLQLNDLFPKLRAQVCKFLSEGHEDTRGFVSHSDELRSALLALATHGGVVRLGTWGRCASAMVRP